VSGEIPDPLDQIVEIASELLQREPGAEQPPERIGRKMPGQLQSPHLVDRRPVFSDAIGHRIGTFRRLSRGQGVGELPEDRGTGPGGGRPGLRRMLPQNLKLPLSNRPADHDHVVTQSHQSPKQGLRIGHVRQAASPFAHRLSHQRFKSIQALARPHRQSAQIRLCLIVQDRHRFHLLGQKPRDFGCRLQNQPGRAGWNDQDRDQQPDRAAQTDFNDAVRRETERAQRRACGAQQYDDGRDRRDAETGRVMRKPAEYAAMNESGATATTRAAAVARPSACGIMKATPPP
jgi:hypothetical protein